LLKDGLSMLYFEVKNNMLPSKFYSKTQNNLHVCRNVSISHKKTTNK